MNAAVKVAVVIRTKAKRGINPRTVAGKSMTTPYKSIDPMPSGIVASLYLIENID